MTAHGMMKKHGMIHNFGKTINKLNMKKLLLLLGIMFCGYTYSQLPDTIRNGMRGDTVRMVINGGLNSINNAVDLTSVQFPIMRIDTIRMNNFYIISYPDSINIQSPAGTWKKRLYP